MPRTRTRTDLCISLALVAATAATFYPVLRCGFVNFDDMEHVARNPVVNHPGLIALGRIWEQSYFGLWIPVTYSIWLLTGALSIGCSHALEPIYFHSLNLVVHAFNSVLVYLILGRRMTRPRAAALGAGIFAVHPIQVEAVAWVSGLRDLLAGGFSLLAIWLYLRDVQKNVRGRIAATIFFGLALLSKPTAAVASLILVILLGTRWRGNAWWIALWLALGALALAIAVRVQPSGDVFRPALFERPIVALDSVAFYAGKLVVPRHFAIDYGRTPQRVLGDGSCWWAGAAVLLAGIVLFAIRGRTWNLAAGGAIAVVGLLPVMGLIPFSFQYYSTVADRYFYLSMLGVALCIAALVEANPRVGTALVAITVAVLGVVSNLQARVWRNTETLCHATLASHPDSIAALHILTFESLSAGNWEAAMRYNDRSLRSRPGDPMLLFDRGNVLRDAGRLPEALREYGAALEMRPDDPQIRNNYAVTLARLGRDNEAEEQFEQLLRRTPGDADARANWGTLLAKRGERERALAEFKRALADDPDCTNAERGLRALEGGWREVR